ncbi:MAG: aromatic amino acid lyase [Acidimicrobiales bacterium]
MTVVVQSRQDFTLENYRRVSIDGESVEIGPGAIRAMDESRRSFMAFLDSDRTAFIYGTTTGAGEGAKRPIAPEEQRGYAVAWSRRSRRGTSFGEERLPDTVVRGIIFARLANYVEGNAKSRPVVAERIAEMLERPLAKVPVAGEVGAGEIIPLAHVMSTFRHHDLELEEGEPMALVNGSPCSAALAADTALRAGRRLDLAEQVFALSIEAFRAPLEPYDPVLKDLWRDRYEGMALDALASWLEEAPREGRRPFQAPVSYRILPRVLGQAHRAVATLEEVAEIAISSVTDNPVYVPADSEHPNGRAFSTGGYHNASAYPAIDGVSASWADLCGLAERHTMKLHDGSVSLLPHHLSTSEDDRGATAGLAMMQIGFSEQARHEAARTFLPASESGGFTGQNDVASPTFFAYSKEGRAAWCLDACLASLAATSSQALFVTERQAPPRLQPLVSVVRELVPPPGRTSDQDLGDSVGALAGAFGEMTLGRGGSLFAR